MSIHPASGTRLADDGGQDELDQLRAVVARQQEVISALVDAAERRWDAVARLGFQNIVERRTAKAHQAERVLRSVIEALDGALCIVGRDGTVLDANGAWLRELPWRFPASDGTGTGAGAGAGAGAGMNRAPRPGLLGTDFFDWCRSAAGLGQLAGEIEGLVRQAITTDVDTLVAEPRARASAERSVKGLVSVGDQNRWVVVRVHPIRDHAAARAAISMIDITEGMSTQEQLRRATEEAQRLALVARATDNGVVITLPDGAIEWANDPFVRQTGFELHEVVGKPRLDFMTCEGDLTEFREFAARVERALAADGEFPLVARSGERYWASLQVRPVVEEGRVAHLVWVEQDITARRDTQQRLHAAITQAELLATALSQEKHLLTGVISAVPQLVYWKNAEGRYVGCNAAFLNFRGMEESQLLGRTEAELAVADALMCALAELEPTVTRSGNAVVDRKMDLADSHGQVRSLLLSVLPLDDATAGGRGVIGVGADITRARELERQLAQANRLESIGQLAAGIAHEINTPIQYVADNVAFLSDATGDLLSAAQRIAGLAATSSTSENVPAAELRTLLDPLDLDFLSGEIPGALSESKEGLGRVTEIVRAMKEYAHPGATRREIDVNRAVESTVQVCRNEWKYVAKVELDLDPGVGLVPCFEGELKQVILNMVVNAAQAIGEDQQRRSERNLGTIGISTRRTTDELLIMIRDDGPGMDEKVRQRVFDPFFTTKEVGKGSGQGLSLAHAVIVTKHHGRIDLETAPGQGACFTLHLPLEPPPEPPAEH